MSYLDLPRTLSPTTRKPYAERFSSASEVKEVVDDLIHQDKTRSQRRARDQGIIDGNPPYPPGILRANAQAWRANVNFREAEGLVQAQRTPYYDLIVEVKPCIEIEIDYGKGVQKQDWAMCIAAEFHRMLFGWDSFDWHVGLQQSEMLVHGIGSHVWTSKNHWEPRTLRMEKCLFPEGSKSDLSDLDFFVVRDSVKTMQLWHNIRNRASATKMGWYPKAVEQAIIDASTQAGVNSNTSFETAQMQLKNGDMGHGYRHREIELCHVFVKEVEGGKNGEGGISHYVIAQNATEPEYLFKSRNKFETFSETLCIFPYDIGSDGTLHSVRGLGTRMAPFMELSNRLKNHMVDQVLVGSGILLSQNGNPDIQKAQLTKIGPLSILPQGFKPEALKLQDLAQGPLALTRELQQTLMENTKTYRQSVSDNSSRERTAFEVSVNAADTAKLNKGAHNHYYRQLTRFYREMLRRALLTHTSTDPAGIFQMRCKDAGVPDEALKKVCHVEAVRSLGAGSASQRLLVAQQLIQVLYPITDEAGKRNILKDWTASLTGYSMVGRYVSEQELPTDDDAIAVLENNDLVEGADVLITPTQNHFKHATQHLLKAQSLVQGLQQGQGDPQAVAMGMDALGSHTAAHLQLLSQDPTRKAQFQQLQKEWVALSKISDQLKQQLAEMQEAQQPEPQPDPETALKMQRQAADIEMKQNKTQLDMGIKQAKAQQALQIKDAMTAAEIRAKRPYMRGNGE